MRKSYAASLILATFSILSFSVDAQTQSRQELLAQIESKRAELQKLQDQFLAPSDEDRAAFAELLKQCDAGLIRPRNEPDVRCEFKRFRKGVVVDEMLYKRSLPVQVNSTYLLRSINFGTSDLLIGFRVARKEPDGSVIVAWKKLKEFRRPDFDRVSNVNPNQCPIK